jgi:hypothetical protein
MDRNELNKKKGRVEISFEMFQDLKPEMLKEIFSRFYPRFLDTNYHINSLVYYGISPDFEDVEIACVEPTYYIQLQTFEDSEEFKITFVKQ